MPYLLVVEDDPDSAEVLCVYLRKCGYRVECLPNGKEALSSILMHSPDLVVLDLLMPYMDGASLIEVLRSYRRWQSLPIVVFSGVAEGPLAERARQLNVNTILTKGRATLQDIGRAVEHELSRAESGQSHPPREWTAAEGDSTTGACE